MNAEDRFIADGEHLNCPHCGGSGHIDDTPNTAAPWVCVGCGKEAVGKVKTCDCPSGLIYQRGDLKSAELALTQQQGGEQEVGDLLRECYEWLFESKADGPRVSEGAIERGYYTPEFRDLHDRLRATIDTTPPTQQEGIAAPAEQLRATAIDLPLSEADREELKDLPVGKVLPPKHGDDAGDGMRYVLCKFGFGKHWQDWLLIPHVDGQYVSAAKLPDFSVSILRHALAGVPL